MDLDRIMTKKKYMLSISIYLWWSIFYPIALGLELCYSYCSSSSNDLGI